MKIARFMGSIAILAVNAALVRAFVFQWMFCGSILISVALQVGLWCLLHSRGRLRGFWSGFEVFGTTAVLVLYSCELFPSSPLNRLMMSYRGIVVNLAYTYLCDPVFLYFDDHQGQLLAVIYFMPKFVAALLGA